VGKWADLLVLDADLRVKRVFIAAKDSGGDKQSNSAGVDSASQG
jgi:hypothetical protein